MFGVEVAHDVLLHEAVRVHLLGAGRAPRLGKSALSSRARKSATLPTAFLLLPTDELHTAPASCGHGLPCPLRPSREAVIHTATFKMRGHQAPSAHGFHSRAGFRLRRRRRLLLPWLEGRHGGVGSLLVRLLALVDAGELGKVGARVPVVLVRVG